MHDTLKKYWSIGYATLPTLPDKRPALQSGESWIGGITDPTRYTHGIGIICGLPSGNIECWDFDNHQGDAKENISAFIEEIRPLYERYKFPIETTLNGGFHLLLKCAKISGSTKLASRPKWEEKMNNFRPDAIIETKGEGGYFVAAPSPGYSVIRNSIIEIPEITEGERAHMILVAKTFNTWHELKPTEHESKDRPGDIFNQSVVAGAEAKETLIASGWGEIKNGIWRRPGKTEGISATFGRVAENIFYNFSANAFPFEPGRAYTPFQVITLLKYNGDFKEHARILADRFNLNQPAPKQFAKKTENKYRLTELDEILKKNVIDFSIPVTKPPLVLKIRDFDKGKLYDRRLFTLGNFSAITGKSKAKKTFLTTLFLAAATKCGEIDNKIIGVLPFGKDGVLNFDTEQSPYDSFISGKRVFDLIGFFENFGSFQLREFSPLERCQIVEYALEKFKNKIGYVVIDGIADLANGNNDEEEAIRVVGLLMRWTKIYNTHISVVIHQNKNDNYATGHLGSAILKKSECIISVEKNKDDRMKSIVRCDMIRGTAEFSYFEIIINEKYLPEITENKNLSSHYEVEDSVF